MSASPKILRMRDLLDSGRVPNRATGYRWIREGIFPPGRLYGPNVRGWTEEELAEHDASLPTALRANAMRGKKRPDLAERNRSAADQRGRRKRPLPTEEPLTQAVEG